ncbi:hypothetical protein ATY81_22195 [Rhizobium sp. R72]|nr:hypothetical protein ATY81_22195 [Rhizobium sp. R72]OWW02490.1 hypothetical protein ATY80_22195 [Rhizobium sp. R711]
MPSFADEIALGRSDIGRLVLITSKRTEEFCRANLEASEPVGNPEAVRSVVAEPGQDDQMKALPQVKSAVALHAAPFKECKDGIRVVPLVAPADISPSVRLISLRGPKARSCHLFYTTRHLLERTPPMATPLW